jgi:hypothetical protein
VKAGVLAQRTADGSARRGHGREPTATRADQFVVRAGVLAQRAALSIGASMLAMIASCARPPATPLYRATFEDVCDGTPCGWQQVSGPAGGAIFVETLPGEHGVRLIGDGVAISGPADGDEIVGGSITPGGLQAHIVARCDAGAILSIIVSMQDVSGTPIDMFTSLDPSETWNGDRPVLPLMAQDPLVTPLGFSDILGVILRKEGAGACEIDYFSLGSLEQPFVE